MIREYPRARIISVKERISRKDMMNVRMKMRPHEVEEQEEDDNDPKELMGDYEVKR